MKCRKMVIDKYEEKVLKIHIKKKIRFSLIKIYFLTLEIIKLYYCLLVAI